MNESRRNAGPHILLVVVGSSLVPAQRVTRALAAIDAEVSVVRGLAEARIRCRDIEPTLILLELPRMTAERLNADIGKLRGVGIRAPIFVVGSGITPTSRPAVVTDIADFAAEQAGPQEIAYRIQRILEAAGRPPRPSGTIRRIGALRIDWRNRLASRGTRSVRFTATELRLLESLLDRRERMISSAQLLAALGNGGESRSPSLVAVYIFALRGKLRRLDPSLSIENEVGAGYRLTMRAVPSGERTGTGRRASAKRSA